MRNILITGAAGFIARNFIQNYYRNDNLFFADKLSACSDLEFYNDLPNDRKIGSNISSITTDVLDKHQITHVINFASESHVDNSIKDPVSFTTHNTYATHKLLDTCLKYGKIQKFIQVGTDEVYGALGPSDRPFSEETNLSPNSPYSASKAAQDMMCRAYFETFKFPVVITRCSNNYGPWQHPEKLLPKVVMKLMNKEKIPVYGNGLNVRDWIHVDDHCLGINLALNIGEPGEVYNFGGNSETSNIDMIRLIIEIFNDMNYHKEILNEKEVIEFVEDRKGHDSRYAIDYWKANKQLGFEPNVSLYNGIVDFVEWAIENKEWLDARS